MSICMAFEAANRQWFPDFRGTIGTGTWHCTIPGTGTVYEYLDGFRSVSRRPWLRSSVNQSPTTFWHTLKFRFRNVWKNMVDFSRKTLQILDFWRKTHKTKTCFFSNKMENFVTRTQYKNWHLQKKGQKREIVSKLCLFRRCKKMKTEKNLKNRKNRVFFRKNSHENVHQFSRKNEPKLNGCELISFALPFKPSQAKSVSFS